MLTVRFTGYFNIHRILHVFHHAARCIVLDTATCLCLVLWAVGLRESTFVESGPFLKSTVPCLVEGAWNTSGLSPQVSSPTAKRKSKLRQRFSAAEHPLAFLLLQNWSRVETIFVYSVMDKIFRVLIDRPNCCVKELQMSFSRDYSWWFVLCELRFFSGSVLGSLTVVETYFCVLASRIRLVVVLLLVVWSPKS